MRIGAAVLVLFSGIGVVAAAQRDYFSGSDASCAKIGTTAGTIIAGPLNDIGANPTIECDAPGASKQHQLTHSGQLERTTVVGILGRRARVVAGVSARGMLGTQGQDGFRDCRDRRVRASGR